MEKRGNHENGASVNQGELRVRRIGSLSVGPFGDRLEFRPHTEPDSPSEDAESQPENHPNPYENQPGDPDNPNIIRGQD